MVELRYQDRGYKAKKASQYLPLLVANPSSASGW